MFGSKDQTIVENAATVKRAVDELNMVSKREKFMRFSWMRIWEKVLFSLSTSELVERGKNFEFFLSRIVQNEK